MTKDCPKCDKKYEKPDSFYSHWWNVHKSDHGPYKEFMRKQEEAEKGNRPDGKFSLYLTVLHANLRHKNTVLN